ncbi:MAG: DUF3576 domain-containing protein [Rhodobacterales bacterium]|nr:DUF3576 domain-containing protein [Rhodobacterales bacterium]
MTFQHASKSRALKTTISLVIITALASCGGTGIGNGLLGGGKGLFRPKALSDEAEQTTAQPVGGAQTEPTDVSDGTSVFDIFKQQDNGTNVKVNRYLWNASLDILNFLPIQSVDPFTGVIVTGYGTPPGGGRAYRATILIKDPALDARSITVALATRGGPVSASTQRAVEDAILARARQLRIKDASL